jgi:hypothetical protein
MDWRKKKKTRPSRSKEKERKEALEMATWPKQKNESEVRRE